MHLKYALLAAVAVLSPTLVEAQTAPTPAAPKTQVPNTPAKDAPTAVEGVTITSDSTAMRASIDRRSYSVANDLSAKTGSIADALRNIPSVEVDVQGNVSLRGDANVTIMIDGKPSGMFSGDGKADALQSLPADQIDRVEVMTNPSAAYRPDGSAGIINLITKKTQKPGVNGTARLNVGPNGRYNGGVSATRREGKLTLSGDAGYRHDTQKGVQEIDRAALDKASGQFLPSRFDAAQDNEGGALTLRGGADYDLDKQNRISGEVRLRRWDFDSSMLETYSARDAQGAVSRAYARTSDADITRDNKSVSADWRRQLKGVDHTLTAHLEHEVTDSSRDSANVLRNAPGVTVYETLRFGQDQTRTNLKVDYSKPLPDDVKLKTGVDIEWSSNDYDNRGATGAAPNALTVDPTRTNRFLYDQDVYAAYVTYERPFGDFTVQGGLRAEQVQIDTNQLTSNQKNQNDYFRLYPTLHMGYTVSQSQTLNANYSRRVQRPGAQDLNPYEIYLDPFNYRAGNPDLKPQITDSYELGWQYRKGQTYYLATAYFRDTRDSVTDVVVDRGGGVLLTTRANLGKSRAGGLELVANGRLSPKLTYNVSGNLFWNEIDAGNLGFAGNRSGTAVSGRANMNWQATPKDFFQINAFTSGKRLTPQGYREPFKMLNLGYRRKVNDKLSLVVTATDVLDNFAEVIVVDTPTLRDRTRRSANVRSVFFGFSYAFGGGKPRPEQFDFNAGGGPG
ncbi:TonB-dependent receptor domain-containing protein [Caulobacter sp. BP25]|uniref:TonB-dependent receptor domain-containing protein n=1 Tax=Caulobacter sp. BP25 TaxID=2048900 RepID=UPI000C12C5D0|nr:TonB-dependent receptor [Caulobacter sp. BP25]PHY21243.1 TonB-dependent receptor [Caulobacter sp. BP25]